MRSKCLGNVLSVVLILVWITGIALAPGLYKLLLVIAPPVVLCILTLFNIPANPMKNK